MDNRLTNYVFYQNKVQQNSHLEQTLAFGKNNLRVFPISNLTFNILPHIELEKEQTCLIDNLWISFNQIFNNQANKNLDRKYFISCLNSLSEYFHRKNKENNFSFYVIYQGHRTRIFKTWEVLPNISNHPRPIFKGFYNITQALDQCKTNLGENYFISTLVN